MTPDPSIAIRQRWAMLRVVQLLRAAGIANPTSGDVRERLRAEAEQRWQDYLKAKSTFPPPVPVETLEQNESRARAEWLQRNAVNVDYDGSLGATVQRVRTATAEKRRARTLAERRARVDNFEASLRGSNA